MRTAPKRKSKMFETVRGYYARGFWTLDRVKDAVEKGWITEEEYRNITRIEH